MPRFHLSFIAVFLVISLLRIVQSPTILVATTSMASSSQSPSTASAAKVNPDEKKADVLVTEPDKQYCAPYHTIQEGCERVPGGYFVRFVRGYSLEEHYAFLGRKFEILVRFPDGYGADLDDNLFAAVRRDPGVRFVEDDSYAELESDEGDE